MRYIAILLLMILALDASTLEEKTVKKQIGRMLVIGFDGAEVTQDSQIVKDIQKYDLGGVILFDKYYDDRTKIKNIASTNQLKKLTQKLQKFSTKPLLVSVDQEGGKVRRLKAEYGFSSTPSALSISKMKISSAKKAYSNLAKELQDVGVNCNFAPVVDLSVNPQNTVIIGLERSYGDVDSVVKYSSIFIDELEKNNVLSVLKHFPGHGSSFGDSHKGFVDISNTWSAKELEPYKKLIDANKVDMIMTAHVFNSQLDKTYPATLSYDVNTKLLRENLGFRGVIVSDDLQMRAISKHYSLKKTVTLAINSGVDILLFGNQLASQDLDELVNTIYKQVQSGAIKYERILESNTRIENLHTKNAIVHKPIIFQKQRRELTKAYIKEHYGLNVKDITIEPKSIVLHWTAIMGLDKCYDFLHKQTLQNKRPDIVKAGALNVSSHFMVDRDGTIYQFMPDNWMARHVIGLNYSAIGIENVGGEGNKKEDLTQAQVDANIKLIKYLKQKYPDIEYLLGHYEYKKMQKTPLWLELDDGYRTHKVDPGKKFMRAVRSEVDYLGLKTP